LEREDDPTIRQSLKEFLRPDEDVSGELPADDRERLSRFCRYVTELFGYKCIYFLVDPDADISPDEEVAWQVLEPLLSRRRLLDLSGDGAAFKFFLSHRFQGRVLSIPWIKHEQSKIVHHLEWPDDKLRLLLRERLMQCSGKAPPYVSLGELSEVSDLDERVIQLSQGSPRELVVICNRLFNEHCRRWSPGDKEHRLITSQEIGQVLAPFAERLKESKLERLIAQGESSRLEFKSTMRYNLKAKRRDKEMDRAVAKTLCAFMNTEGGTLIIGVSDEGKALGLEADFSTLGRRQNRDGFEQAFASLVAEHLGSAVQPYIHSSFEEYQGKLIYVVQIDQRPKPAFCSFDRVDKFFIRAFTTTRELDARETLDYFSDHFR
jgi:hypothetical protein